MEDENALLESLRKQNCSRYIGTKGEARTLEEAERKQMNIMYIDRRCIQDGDNSLKYTTQLAKPFQLNPF
jgi:hypothetical protein